MIGTLPNHTIWWMKAVTIPARFCGRNSQKVLRLAKASGPSAVNQLSTEDCSTICIHSEQPYCDCKCGGMYHGGLSLKAGKRP